MARSSALAWIVKEAKRLRREYPKRFKTWREYVAQASAIYASKHKGKSPVGKKKIGTKKAAYKKRKPTHQTGTTTKRIDQKRTAKQPGKRKSKTGKTYYEYRKNRSDMPGKMTGITRAIDGSAYREMILGHMRDVERARHNAEIEIDRLKIRKRNLPKTERVTKRMIDSRISELKKFIASQKKEMSMLKALYK